MSDAASTLKGRLSLATFDKISTCLNDEWDCEEVENSDYESDSDASGYEYYDGSNRYGEYRYREEYTVVKCEIKRFSLYTEYLWGWTKVTSLETEDLKDLIVIEKPEITFIGGYHTFSAPNGRWFTVGDLFDTIADHEASYREGPSNHVYFEGFGRNRRGHYGVTFWGS